MIRSFALTLAVALISMSLQAQTTNTFPSSGNVGVGTTTPSATVDVKAASAAVRVEGLSGTDGEFQLVTSRVVGNSSSRTWRILSGSGAGNQNFRIYDGTAGADRFNIDANGNIGIGTVSPLTQLHILKSVAGALGPELRLENSGNAVGDASAVTFASNNVIRGYIRSRVETDPNTANSWPGTMEFWTGYGPAVAERMRVTGTGDVGIGTTTPTAKLDVAGNVRVQGTITATSVIGATYQDVAEWVPATAKMPAGTVVILNPDKRNEVMPSNTAYDTSVAGVVSAQPGIILGVAAESKAQVATTGRVKVHVDAGTRGIKIGDLLVTSSKPGTAMVSQPVEFAGIKMHRPGTLIGKALEPLASGEGEVLVLLSLQ